MTRLTVALFALAALSGVAHAETMELGAKLKGTKLVKRRLDFLAENPDAADKALGAGVRIVPLGKRNLPMSEYFDLLDTAQRSSATIRQRVVHQPISFKPGLGSKLGSPRYEPGIVLQGDKLGEGHVSGGSGMNPALDLKALLADMKPAKPLALTKSKGGGQFTSYVVEKDGRRVGVVDLENHYYQNADGKKGAAAFEYSGELQHGMKLGQHLGLDRKQPPKRAVIGGKLVGRR